MQRRVERSKMLVVVRSGRLTEGARLPFSMKQLRPHSTQHPFPISPGYVRLGRRTTVAINDKPVQQTHNNTTFFYSRSGSGRKKMDDGCAAPHDTWMRLCTMESVRLLARLVHWGMRALI
jgi:hypothetical protein